MALAISDILGIDNLPLKSAESGLYISSMNLNHCAVKGCGNNRMSSSSDKRLYYYGCCAGYAWTAKNALIWKCWTDKQANFTCNSPKQKWIALHGNDSGLTYTCLPCYLSARPVLNDWMISKIDYIENQIFLLYCWGTLKNRKRKQVYQNFPISHPIAIFCNIYIFPITKVTPSTPIIKSS